MESLNDINLFPSQSDAVVVSNPMRMYIYSVNQVYRIMRNMYNHNVLAHPKCSLEFDGPEDMSNQRCKLNTGSNIWKKSSMIQLTMCGTAVTDTLYDRVFMSPLDAASHTHD